MFTAFDKALASFIASLVALLAVFNINVPFLADPVVQTVVVSVVSGIVTYFVPNKTPAAA